MTTDRYKRVNAGSYQFTVKSEQNLVQNVKWITLNYCMIITKKVEKFMRITIK